VLRFPALERNFFFPKCTNQLWITPILFSAYEDRGYSGQDTLMTSYLHLVGCCGTTPTCQHMLSWQNASLNTDTSYLQDLLMCWFISYTSQWWRFNNGVVHILCDSFSVPVHSLTSQLCYTIKTQLWSQASLCGICDRQGGHGIGFSPCTFVLPCQCYSTNVPHSYFIDSTDTI